MADDLYERYKEALRTGHVAVLRGALKDALAAYKVAAQIAPSRAMPHTSMGGVHLRMGHLEEALAEYTTAVEKAPHDEGALLGQAEAMTAAGQRVEAAAVLDHVAEIQEAAGRLPEASDTLRRALELADDPERGKRQRALVRQIRFSAGDKAAEQRLARALRLRAEEPAAAGPAGSWPEAGPRGAPGRANALPDLPEPALPAPAAFAAFATERRPKDDQPAAETLEAARQSEPEPATAEAAEESEWVRRRDAAAAPRPEPEPEPATPAPRREPELELEPEPEPATAGPQPDSASERERQAERRREPEPAMAEAELEVEAELEPEPQLEPEPAPQYGFEDEPAPPPQPVAVMADAESIFGPVGPTRKGGPTPAGDELLAAAEAADEAGDTASLRSLLLWTARAYAREGRFEAGLDAAHRLLQRAPNDVDAHLALVELYLARHWDSLAADKMRLLGRLAEFNEDAETRMRLSRVASRAFPEDTALTSAFS
jgi:tetratricopeptide (TPR) repeat protein